MSGSRLKKKMVMKMQRYIQTKSWYAAVSASSDIVAKLSMDLENPISGIVRME